MSQVWYCKIGVKGHLNPSYGGDLPMRQALREAFRQVTGVDAEFLFSGWNSDLTDAEKRVAGIPVDTEKT